MEEKETIRVGTIGTIGNNHTQLYEALSKTSDAFKCSLEEAERAVKESLDISERFDVEKAGESLKGVLKTIKLNDYLTPEVVELAKALPYSYDEVYSYYIQNCEDIERTREELTNQRVVGIVGSGRRFIDSVVDAMKDLSKELIYTETDAKEKIDMINEEIFVIGQGLNSKKQKKTNTWNKKKFYE